MRPKSIYAGSPGFTGIYLLLLPTNHGTYLRSVAFGGAMFFAARAVGLGLLGSVADCRSTDTRCLPGR